MLDIKNMECTYDKVIFSNLNINKLSPGINFIIGRSGCGKTSLIKSIIGLNDHAKGKIFLNNKQIKDFQKFREEYVSIVFQDDKLLSYYTIKENLFMISNNLNKIKNLLSRFHLLNKINNYPDELSGGQRQRINIIRACLKNAYINIFDEPTSSVNDELKEELMDFIKDNFKDKIVIIISHNLKLVNKYADRIIDIENKKDTILNKNNDDKIVKTIFKPPLLKLTLNSYKKRSYLPMVVIIFVYLIFYSTFSLFEGIDNYVIYNLEKKIDYNYFYLMNIDEDVLSNELNNIDIIPLNDYRTYINENLISKILFNNHYLSDYYEIHIYDGDENILINKQLYEIAKTNEVSFLEDIYQVKVIDDGKIYTSPNIYFDYSFLEKKIGKIKSNNICFKVNDYQKTYDYLQENFDNIYTINNNQNIKFDNSTILINESLKQLLKSIHSLILLLSYSVIFMAVTFIKTLIDYNIKMRKEEIDIYRYFGLKNLKDIVVLESLILTTIPLIFSTILFINLTPLFNKLSPLLLGEYFPMFTFNINLLTYAFILDIIINLIIYYGNRFNKNKQKVSLSKSTR